MNRLALLLAFCLLLIPQASAETVSVKYRGAVDLASFECERVTRSSLVKRVCYDPSAEYMIIRLRRTYSHYCDIDAATVAGLLSARSMGRFFNANIRGGSFDC